MVSEMKKQDGRICPYCGTQLDKEARFCHACGGAQPEERYAVPKPKKKIKKSLILIPVLLILAILAGAFAWRLYSREKEYRSHIETGLRFLSEGEYQEAVLAFDAAIEIKPKSAEAHIGRGDANTGLERYRDAENDYGRALELSSKDPAVYLGLANVYLERGKGKDAIRILEEGAEVTGDSRLSEWAKELERLQKGNSSLNGAVSEYLQGGGTALLPGAKVRLYVVLDDVPRLARAETTDSQGGFSLTGLPAGTYTLHVDAEDHIGIVTTEALEEDTQSYTELFLMIPETRSVRRGETGSLSAQVTNALSGEAVDGAQVTLRSGWNNQSGRSVGTAQTDGSGSFYIGDLAYGYYTAETSSQDFMTAYHNVAVLPNDYTSEWSLPMSPVLGAGETRIVLTWNEHPWDLDSHLVSEEFHVYFADRDGYDSLGRHRANLDLDDTDSYGPETVTIYQGVDGVYTYSVFDYTNGSYESGSSSSALSASGATVRVYQGSGLAAEYHVPTGAYGYTWTVFRIHAGGRIETVNTVGYDLP